MRISLNYYAYVPIVSPMVPGSRKKVLLLFLIDRGE